MDADVNHVANTIALIQHAMRNFDAHVSPAAGVMTPSCHGGPRQSPDTAAVRAARGQIEGACRPGR
jgi:hypothetical protein